MGLRVYLIVIAFCAGSTSTANAHNPLEFKFARFELPADEAIFTGDNADVVNENCLACHSTEMIMVQPTFAKATWEAITYKMINVYKAPVAQKNIKAIVDYLSSHRSSAK